MFLFHPNSKYILWFLLFLMGAPMRASIWKVCNTCENSSIKETIARAHAYDTLLVQKGRYREFEILVDKPLVIRGIGYPIVDGEKKGEIFRVTSDHVTLDGFFIVNVGVSYTKDNAAIRVVQSKNFQIKNMVLEQLFFGIYLEKSSHGKVYHNRIIGEAVDEYNSGNGIQLWYSSDIEVLKNHIQGTRDGIYLEFSDRVTISENVSMDNLRYGLHFMFSNNDIYTNNTFENNGAGVAVMFSKFITMKNNTFRKNWGTAAYGMLLKEINDAEIKGNIFEENTIGINIEGSNRIKYTDNDFIGNGWAIRVIGACYTNSFKSNNFLYNSFDISYNSKLNDNVFEGNFWSSYTGYDLDKDGIGDVPYRPVKLFSYVVNRTPETIVLLRSLFMDIIDFSERVSPVFTPDNLKDAQPLMKVRL